MRRLITFSLMLCLACLAKAQTTPWVTKQYAIDSATVTYQSGAIDYRNLPVNLSMDVSWPTNDPTSSCGRPLMIIVHGGSFLGGDRNEGDLKPMRRDFAKRGYVVASIDYRLGFFQTFNSYGCALMTLAGRPWDCLNATDSLEWYRALHRGVQDAHSAIRYFMNNPLPYNVDPSNVFVVGESAGAFIALGTGFIDVAGEQLPGTGARPNAPQPNNIYVGKCTGTTANMNLARPDLGSYLGTGNWPAQRQYRIRGVGDLYGGCFKNPFLQNANNAQIPSLYVFHQVADRIVSHNSTWLFVGASYCLVSSGTCPTYPINVPFSHGGTTVKNWVNALAGNGQPRPVMQAEIVNNPKYCEQWFGGYEGHTLDNYSLRTTNMATFFSTKIGACSNKVGEAFATQDMEAQVFPNPSTGTFNIQLQSGNTLSQLEVYDLVGKRVLAEQASGNAHVLALPTVLARGTYILRLVTAQGLLIRRIVLE